MYSISNSVGSQLVLCDNVEMIKKKACQYLDEQGYASLSVKEKNRLNIALRVTPTVCIIFVIIGLYYQSVWVFLMLAVFGILGAVTSKGQPIDVLYNLIARMVKWPKLPPSPIPRRFACGVGMVFLAGAGFSLYLDDIVLGYVFGMSYIIAAGIMAISHLCVASWVYNRVLGK